MLLFGMASHEPERDSRDQDAMSMFFFVFFPGGTTDGCLGSCMRLARRKAFVLQSFCMPFPGRECLRAVNPRSLELIVFSYGY